MVSRRNFLTGTAVAAGGAGGAVVWVGTHPAGAPAKTAPSLTPRRGAVAPGGNVGITGALKGEKPVLASRTATGDWAAEIPVMRTIVGDTGTVATIVKVEQAAGSRLQVRIPKRDSDLLWVPAESVSQYVQYDRLVVDVGARTAAYFTPEGPTWQGRVAVGKQAAPTPLGASWVSELVHMPSADGPYGIWAWGLAMWSETLTEFGDGDAQIAVHGTNRDDQIGEPVSSGCVRVENQQLVELGDAGFGPGSIVEMI